MKDWMVTYSLTHTVSVEAETEDEAREAVKQKIFLHDDIELDDSEIIEIEEQ